MDGPDLTTWVAWVVAVAAFVLGAQVLGITGLGSIFILIGIAALAFAWTGWQRAHPRLARREARFRPTTEVFADPTTGVQTRVFVDPETGERRYWPDH